MEAKRAISTAVYGAPLPWRELTLREKEILQLVGLGYTVAEIAGNLRISAKTVDVHINNMRHKLNLPDRVQLALYAINCGLVSMEMINERFRSAAFRGRIELL